jgi:hypothetical protein
MAGQGSGTLRVRSWRNPKVTGHGVADSNRFQHRGANRDESATPKLVLADGN